MYSRQQIELKAKTTARHFTVIREYRIAYIVHVKIFVLLLFFAHWYFIPRGLEIIITF